MILHIKLLEECFATLLITHHVNVRPFLPSIKFSPISIPEVSLFEYTYIQMKYQLPTIHTTFVQCLFFYPFVIFRISVSAHLSAYQRRRLNLMDTTVSVIINQLHMQLCIYSHNTICLYLLTSHKHNQVYTQLSCVVIYNKCIPQHNVYSWVYSTYSELCLHRIISCTVYHLGYPAMYLSSQLCLKILEEFL